MSLSHCPWSCLWGKTPLFISSKCKSMGHLALTSAATRSWLEGGICPIKHGNAHDSGPKKIYPYFEVLSKHMWCLKTHFQANWRHNTCIYILHWFKAKNKTCLSGWKYLKSKFTNSQVSRISSSYIWNGSQTCIIMYSYSANSKTKYI